MICPNCKKQETTELKINKNDKEVLRERYCPHCDFSFTSVEKIKSFKKRKPRADKLLMNLRFYIYGTIRAFETYRTYRKIKKKVKLNKLADVKYSTFSKSGKTGIHAIDSKTKKEIILKTEKKKETIEKALLEAIYWNYKNKLFNKNPIISNEEISIINNRLLKYGLKKWRTLAYKNKSEVEKRLANIVMTELEDFHKSVSTYIKSDEYNRNFFLNYYNKEASNLSDKEDYWKETSDMWEDDIYWALYISAR